MSDMDEVVSAWATGMTNPRPEAELPPHHQSCLGCGPDNPHGHHLQVRRDGEDAVLTRHTFDDRHMGAPGIAHGGAVATVVDDLFGFLLYLVGELAVTRRLEIDYRAPVRLGVPYLLHARVVRRDGRKLFVEAEGTDKAGVTALSAAALFIIVGQQHFTAGRSTPRP